MSLPFKYTASFANAFKVFQVEDKFISKATLLRVLKTSEVKLIHSKYTYVIIRLQGKKKQKYLRLTLESIEELTKDHH